jgi:hypothetical protein
LKSKSGKQLTPMPKTLATSKIKAGRQAKEWVQWLIENAKQEATEYELMLISFIKTNKKGLITVAEMDMLNLIIFDKSEVKIDYEN